jgi:heterodisulfide reductase subunit B
MLRLKHAQLHLEKDPDARVAKERTGGRPFDPDLDIIHFYKLLAVALGVGVEKNWLARHLVDPLPLLKANGFIQ